MCCSRHALEKSNVPSEHALIGLGPAFVTVENYEHLQLVLTEVLGFKLIDAEGSFHLFEVGEGGNGASIIVEHREDLPAAQEGYGNVHHLALRVADEEALRFWIEKINRLEFPNSGFVERFTLNLNISWQQHMFYLNWQPMVLDF